MGCFWLRALVAGEPAQFVAHAYPAVTGYRIMVRHLVELEVRDVDFALGKLAKRLSTRSVRLARMILIQAIRNAMVNDPGAGSCRAGHS